MARGRSRWLPRDGVRADGAASGCGGRGAEGVLLCASYRARVTRRRGCSGGAGGGVPGGREGTPVRVWSVGSVFVCAWRVAVGTVPGGGWVRRRRAGGEGLLGDCWLAFSATRGWPSRRGGGGRDAERRCGFGLLGDGGMRERKRARGSKVPAPKHHRRCGRTSLDERRCAMNAHTLPKRKGADRRKNPTVTLRTVLAPER